jgi:electron transfer flavoprotein alpha subunit
VAPSDRAGIWVLAEGTDGRVASAPLEATTEAARLSRLLGTEVTAVLFGGDESAIETLGAHGAETVVSIDLSWDGADSAVPAGVLADLITRDRPQLVLIPGTAMGRDIAPRLAVRLGAGLVEDCIYLRVGDGGRLEATRMEDDGAAASRLVWIGTGPALAMLPPGTFRAEPVGDRPVPRVVYADIADLPETGLRLLNSRKIDPAQLPLEDAPVLVAGGLGMGGPDGFEVLENLASVIGGKVAASRRATDLGWVDHRVLVGQTGKTVRPAIYLACGISGASQHVLGMKESGFIVSINSDPHAPIHGIADLAAIGDVGEIVPELVAGFASALEEEGGR